LKRQTAEKVSVFKGFRAFEKSRSESRLHAPKRRALPTAPHPDCLIISLFFSYVLRYILINFILMLLALIIISKIFSKVKRYLNFTLYYFCRAELFIKALFYVDRNTEYMI